MQNSAIDFYQTENEISFPKQIRFHPSLTFGEKMFLAEVHALSQKNSKKQCPYSSRQLGNLLGVSHQAIINWTKKLQDLQLIEVGVDYNNTACRQFLRTKIN